MNRQRLITYLAIPGLLLCCAALIVGLVWFGIPGLARSNFGPPIEGLSAWQRIYLSARLMAASDNLTTPKDSAGTPQDFTVLLGESPYEIAGHMQQQGLVKDSESLLNYLIYTGLDTSIQAGDYQLSPAMTPLQIADTLQDATPRDITLTVLAGWRLEEVAEALPTTGLSISPEEFLQVTSRPPAGSLISQYLPASATLEGFLAPGDYQLPRETTVEELVTHLTNSFITQLDQTLIDQFTAQGLDLYQAVTLASIVEREVVVEAEMSLIASVFLNRLQISMKLESDPTVQYALGYDSKGQSWWKNPLSQLDLLYDSPYNTYLYPNLPPGPIANPSLEALQAVANPVNSNYYFFRAKCDGSGEHLFAETFEQHVVNECP